MIDGLRKFHEMDAEVKKEFYTRDLSRKVSFLSNVDLYESQATNWRDTLGISMAPHPPSAAELPEVCRSVMRIVMFHILFPLSPYYNVSLNGTIVINLQRHSNGYLKESNEVGIDSA